MSGIEIAGLMLGAIPLVIWALENYEVLLDPVTAFFNFRGELGRAIRELSDHYTSFELSIEILLTPITSDEDRSEMIENSDSALWKKKIEHDLQARPSRAYPNYFRIVQRIQEILLSVTERIENLNGVKGVTRDRLEAIISQHPAAKKGGKLQNLRPALPSRIEFTMKRKVLEILLDEFGTVLEHWTNFRTSQT